MADDSEQRTYQKAVIKALMRKELAKNDNWYIIDVMWLKRWKKYVGYDDSAAIDVLALSPGPVENSFLLEDDMRSLRKGLIEEVDFSLVPQEAFDYLVLWHTLSSGQVPIRRNVIELGCLVTKFMVEVYPLDVDVCLNFHINTVRPASFSRSATMQSVIETLCLWYGVDPDRHVRLRIKWYAKSYEIISDLTKTVGEVRVFSGQLLVLETMDDADSVQGMLVEHTTVPFSDSPGFQDKASSANDMPFSDNPQLSRTQNAGLCGIKNVGNTCFLAAVIQTLSNVPALTEYILAGRWRGDLNTSNPLGSGGHVAQCYAELIRLIWSGENEVVSPAALKKAISDFKSQFAGFQQQDAHECLAVLLDGLHEDLNQATKKSSTDQETMITADREPASCEWIKHRNVNDSIVVDLFHGQLRSTTACMGCGVTSTKFDPFAYLTVPLPMKTRRQMEIILIRMDAWSIPRRFCVQVERSGKVADLFRSFSQLTDIAPEQMLAVRIFKGWFADVFRAETLLSEISELDPVYIYEVPHGRRENLRLVPVFMTEKVLSETSSVSGKKFFGVPVVVTVDKRTCSRKLLYKSILHQTARYVGSFDADMGCWRPYADFDKDLDIEYRKTKEAEIQERTSSGEHYRPLTNCPFDLQIIASFVATDLFKFVLDERPVEFSENPYVVASWTPEDRQKFYDEKKALAVDDDVTVKKRRTEQDHVQLAECLDMFVAEERLEEQDPKRHKNKTKTKNEKPKNSEM